MKKTFVGVKRLMFYGDHIQSDNLMTFRSHSRE